MSAISRAMAAPVKMAMPASASDRAGEVVHAVAHHKDSMPLGFFTADKGGFVLRQDLGVNRVHAHLGGDSLCRTAVVAGHHN